MEETELFKLRNNIGIRTNGYKWAMNKFKMEIKRFPAVRVRLWNSLPVAALKGQIN